jgi:hypothetical protein
LLVFASAFVYLINCNDGGGVPLFFSFLPLRLSWWRTRRLMCQQQHVVTLRRLIKLAIEQSGPDPRSLHRSNPALCEEFDEPSIHLVGAIASYGTASGCVDKAFHP